MSRARNPAQSQASQQKSEAWGLFDIISAQHGSFARYLKIHNSRSHFETGVSSPGKAAGNQPLLPSRLPWSKPPGKSRNRRGLSVATRREAFQWMHTLWALLNYLESGSPSSSHAIQVSVDRAPMGSGLPFMRAMLGQCLQSCLSIVPILGGPWIAALLSSMN